MRAASEFMHAVRIPVEIVMERVPLHNRWTSERWQAARVDAAAGPAPAGVTIERLPPEDGRDRWRITGFEAELHRTEAEGYFFNLTSPEPKAFVMWRLHEEGEPAARPVLVTLSYGEAARFLDAGEQVDAVALAPELADWMRPFIATHYRPEPRRKVRRNDPLADGRGGRD